MTEYQEQVLEIIGIDEHVVVTSDLYCEGSSLSFDFYSPQDEQHYKATIQVEEISPEDT